MVDEIWEMGGRESFGEWDVRIDTLGTLEESRVRGPMRTATVVSVGVE